MRQAGEPSVEEILASIKRVMAREDRGLRAERIEATPHRLASDPDDEDVLDLARHGYPQDGPVVAGQSAQAPAMAKAGDASLVSDAVAANLRGSFGALADVGGRPAAAASVPSDAGLEATLRDLLRPALTQWLDRHLPVIVEKMVAAEIARITSRRD